MKLKSAIIGTGGIAASHVTAVKANADRIEVVAAMDIDESRAQNFCTQHGVPRAYSDFARLLREEKPDLVHICTPPTLHAKLAIQALESGAWAWVEKPMCASLAELDAIQEAERHSGGRCVGVFQYRSGAAMRHFKAQIESGELGRPLLGICHTLWFRGDGYYEVPWRGGWHNELGGPTMGHGIHAMETFLWLMGDWREVQARVATLDRKIEVEDISLAQVEFESGALGSIVNSVLSPRQETYLRFDFQRGTTEMSGLYGFPDQGFRWNLPPGVEATEETRSWSEFEAGESASHALQLRGLLDARERGETPTASGDEARRLIEFLSAIYQSAATQSVVQRGSILPGTPFYNHVAGTLAGK